MNGSNTSPRAKRKPSPFEMTESGRPPKHLRSSLNGKQSAGDNTPDVEAEDFDMREHDFIDDAALQALPALGPDSQEWQATIESVVRNVVSIRFCQTCSFDTDPALNSEATGFVVDAERGYILTNRHVVGSGPFWGYCIFDNHEEVDAYPVYRDPVHDFGILKFDPKAIKYQPVRALPLRPDLAKVGIEIRVVGNDAGEKLSILSGVISRLDRNAPEYGEGYSDFNTSYYQASAAASGGSSGSPVVDIDGYAVALQAGGRADGASTDYFLPLDRPLRALRCLQEGKPITRGDIQCQFLLKPFDECRRLGLSSQWEAQMRKQFPKETNMLVAEIVLPQGPSHNKIEEGDVLIKVNDQLITQFTVLDDIMDSSVGKAIKLLLQRGGEDVEVEIVVGDLHEITPDRFVSVAGGSFHTLSYQQARLYGVACSGVYLCEGTGSFRFDNTENGILIQTLDHKKVPDLETFIEVAKTIPDKARVVVTYKHLRDLHTLNTTIIYVDRHWSSKMKLAVRNDYDWLSETLDHKRACLAKGTLLAKYDGSQIKAEDVKNGDLLLGPDGGPRKASHVVSGKDRLYRIKLGKGLDDLVVTPNHILAMHKTMNGTNAYDGPSLNGHRARLEARSGQLPNLDSQAGADDRPKSKAHEAPNFMSALKKALVWMLEAEPGERGNQGVRNLLNGTMAVVQHLESYQVKLGRHDEWETFAWGNPSKIKNLRGHKDHPTVYYPSQDAAYAAAVVKSREVHRSGETTIYNLRNRYLERFSEGKPGRLNVDESLPGLYLKWSQDGSLKFFVEATRTDGDVVSQTFKVPSFPSQDLSDTVDIEDAPEVKAVSSWADIEMTAEEFATIHDKSEYRLYRPAPFEYPEQKITVDPRFLGIWLGDGNRRNTETISNHEQEIRDFLAVYAAELDLHFVNRGQLKHAIVGRTEHGHRPMPDVTTPPTESRRGASSRRSTILGRRLHAGWNIVPSEYGTASSTWQRPREDMDTHVQSPLHDVQPQTAASATVKCSGNAGVEQPRVRGHRSDSANPDSQGTSQFLSSQPIPEAIPEDPLSQLQEDTEFMSQIGSPDIPVESRSQEEEEAGLVLDMITFDAKGIADEDFTPLETDSGSENEFDEHSESQPTREYRLRSRQRVYGDLSSEEEEILIEQIMPAEENNKFNVNTLLREMDCLHLVHEGSSGPAGDTKHIPEPYMKNSREVRLEVLAGLLDTDGCYQFTNRAGYFRFSQSAISHKRLFWDTVALARSLGFNVTTMEYMSTPGELVKASTPQLRATISGDLDEIPTLLTRKIAMKKKYPAVRNHPIRGVILEEEETEWFGFRVDQDQLYLRHDHLVLHNSAPSKSSMAEQRGLWDFIDLADPLPPVAPVPRKASFIQLEHTSHPAVAELVKSFVHVNCTMPVKLDGFPKNRKWGMGLVIDADKGLVVISRAIVPYDLCDISITIADSIVVEGKVVFLHPLQNYAIIQYDPKLVEAPVQSAKLSTEEITQGASTYFIGYNRIGRVVHTATSVTEIFAVAIPANSGAPRYRAVNVDAITVDTSLSGQCGSGVLVAPDGTVQALWLTYLGERSPSTHRDEEYHLGLATPTLLPVVSQIQKGIVPNLRMLSVEFRSIAMSQARLMGVSEEWIQQVSKVNTSHHQLFMVTKRTFERNETKEALLEGDILLTLNGKLITRISELDVMYDNEFLDAVVVRDCQEMHIRLPTVAADDVETDRAVSFCGAILHRPHHAVRQQISKLFSEVYVSARTRGSPAYQYGLAPTNFITHVNNKPTPDLESFLQAVIEIPDNTYFRLKAVTFDSVPWVVTMKKNEHYFPTVEWIKDPSVECGWRRVTYEAGKKIEGEGAEGVPSVTDDTGEPDDLPAA